MNKAEHKSIKIDLGGVHIEAPIGYRIKVHTQTDGSQSIKLSPRKEPQRTADVRTAGLRLSQPIVPEPENSAHGKFIPPTNAR